MLPVIRVLSLFIQPHLNSIEHAWSCMKTGVFIQQSSHIADHCEMLVLRKEDFDSVLRSSVMAEWDEIRRCMSMFTYFNGWDEITLRDCCILSKVKYYGVDDIILGEDVGDKKYVYFVIEGQCQLVEYLDLEVTESACRKSYKLLSGEDDIPSTPEKDKMTDPSTQTLNERQLSEISVSDEALRQ